MKVSAKLATLDLLKIKVFWNKGYNAIVFVDDVTNKILAVESNYFVDVIMWPKIGNSSISMREIIITSVLQKTIKKTIFLRCALGLVQEFGTGTRYGLEILRQFDKLKVRKVWRLIPTFAEVRGEKLVERSFLPLSHPK